MGRYEGKPLNVLWDDDGRHMQLNAPFAFVDGTEERWDVPNGTRIDGAKRVEDMPFGDSPAPQLALDHRLALGCKVCHEPD